MGSQQLANIAGAMARQAQNCPGSGDGIESKLSDRGRHCQTRRTRPPAVAESGYENNEYEMAHEIDPVGNVGDGSSGFAGGKPGRGPRAGGSGEFCEPGRLESGHAVHRDHGFAVFAGAWFRPAGGGCDDDGAPSAFGQVSSVGADERLGGVLAGAGSAGTVSGAAGRDGLAGDLRNEGKRMVLATGRRGGGEITGGQGCAA